MENIRRNEQIIIMKKIVKRIFSFTFWNRIVIQLIFSHLFLISISVLMVGIFLVSATNTYIEEQVREKHLDMVRNSAKEINSFVRYSLGILTFVSEQQDFATDAVRQGRTIDRMHLTYDYYESLTVVDTNLTIMNSTIFGKKNLPYDNPAFFEKAFGEEMYISPLERLEEDRPIIRVGIPVKEFGQQTGLLVAEIKINILYDIVDSLSNNVEDGYVFIVSENGTVIAHPDRRIVYRNENLSNFNFINDLINGNEGNARYIDPNFNNELMISAYTRVEDFNWGIVISQSESTAFAVSRDILNKLIIIIIGSIALASILGVVITRNMVQPLKFLVAGVKRVSKGSLLENIQIPRTEELATLAIEFNNMTGNLLSIQRQLKQAERLATVSKFASVVAHEIRNPFNSIVINIQVLKRGLQKGESRVQLESLMEVIDSEIRRIDSLIENYLSFTRPKELQASVTDLSIVLDEVILAQHAKAANQNITIVRDEDQVSVEIPADGDQLKQAFLNIILNAFQSMPGGGKLNISILIDHENIKYPDSVLISFRDNGIGIKPDNMPDIFDFFYSSKKGGTGLGLAVTKQIIEGHYGFIEIQSEPKAGTAVLIYLPKNKLSS